MPAGGRIGDVGHAHEGGESRVVVRGLLAADVNRVGLSAATDVPRRGSEAVPEPLPAALAFAHLDREGKRALAVAPAHVYAVEIVDGEVAAL